MRYAIPPPCAMGSPSSRRAWIEIFGCLSAKYLLLSPSSRRAWIEIDYLDVQRDTAYGRPPRGGRG